ERETVDDDDATVRDARQDCARIGESRRGRPGEARIERVHAGAPARLLQRVQDAAIVEIAPGPPRRISRHDEIQLPCRQPLQLGRAPGSGASYEAHATWDSCSVTRRDCS